MGYDNQLTCAGLVWCLQDGNWASEYGHFFLSWYSGLLVAHADRILGVAASVVNRTGRPRMLKGVQQVGGQLAHKWQC